MLNRSINYQIGTYGNFGKNINRAFSIELLKI